MSELKNQLESLSAQHMHGIELTHPAERSNKAETEPMAPVVDLAEARTRRRGRYLFSVAAAVILLVGGTLLFSGFDDDWRTSGAAGTPITGPNGEDLGIWSDAIVGTGAEAEFIRAGWFDEALARSLPEINQCLVEMGSEPFTPASERTKASDSLSLLGTRAFAENEGFGYVSFLAQTYEYPDDLTACYFARTVDGLLGPNDTPERIAATALRSSLALASAEIDSVEALISKDPAIADNAADWATCMSEQGHDYDSEFAARRYFAVAALNLNPNISPNAPEDADLAALKAEEVSVATAAWDCSGGESGAALREDVRRKVLAEFVVANREELDRDFDLALFNACQAARAVMTDEADAFAEAGQDRLRSLGCPSS